MMKPPSRALTRMLCLLTAWTWLFSLAAPVLAGPSLKPLDPPDSQSPPAAPQDAFLVFSPAFIDANLPLGGSTLVSASLENQGDQAADFAFEASSLAIPWLEIEPISGTVAPTSTLPVSLTLDTSPLRQPGIFTTTLEITHTAPMSEIQVPVTLTVTSPPGWGRLRGTVSTPGYCDQHPNPIPGALLTIHGTSDTYTTTTRQDGSYSWWLDAAQSPLSVTVTASSYLTASLAVDVNPGLTTRQDFDLIWLQPCLRFTPHDFDAEVGSGYTVTLPASLWNNGHRQASFSLREVDTGVLIPKLPTQPPVFSPPAPAGPLSLQAPQAEPGRVAQPNPDAPDSWLSAHQIPNGLARYARAQCPEHPDSFYLISGVESTNLPDTNKVLRYDIPDDSWHLLAPFPSPVEGAAAACYAGYIYVAGGSGSNQFYVYDIAQDAWAPGPPLPRDAYGAALGAWQGRLYLVGGSTDFYPENATPQVSIFDIAAGVWSQGADIPAPVVQPGSAQAFNYLYLAGGFDSGYPDSNSAVTQRYNMATDTWELGPSFDSRRAAFAMSATTRRLYAIAGDLSGGTNTDPPSSLVEALDLAGWPTSTWADLSDPLPIALADLSGGFCSQTKTGGEVWAVGGFNINTATTNYYRPTGETCPYFSDVPWLSEAPESGEVAVGETLDWSVSLSAPPTLPLGSYTARLLLLSDDPLQPAAPLPVTMTVSAPHYGVFAGPDQEGSGDPGSLVTYDVLVANTGNGPTDSYSLTLEGGTWTATLSASVTAPLAPYQLETVQVSVDIPAGTLAGEQDLVHLTAQSQGDPTLVYTALMTTTANAVYGISLEPGSQMASGLPGGEAAYVFSLLNTGNLTSTFQLTVTDGNWAVSLPTEVYTLGVGQAAAVDALVHIPSSAHLGDVDLAHIQAQGPDGVLAVAELRTLAALPIPAISLNPPSSQGSAAVGNYAEYQLTLANLSSLDDTVTLSYTGAWQVQLPEVVFSLAPGEQVQVIARVLVPSGASPGEVQITTLLADSLLGASDSAVLLTTALPTNLYLPVQYR